MNKNELQQDIIELRSAGCTYAEMASTLGVSVSLVYLEARKMGLVNIGKPGRTAGLIMRRGQPYTIKALADLACVEEITLRKRIKAWDSIECLVKGIRSEKLRKNRREPTAEVCSNPRLQGSMSQSRKDRIREVMRLLLHSPNGLTMQELTSTLGASYGAIYSELTLLQNLMPPGTLRQGARESREGVVWYYAAQRAGG